MSRLVFAAIAALMLLAAFSGCAPAEELTIVSPAPEAAAQETEQVAECPVVPVTPEESAASERPGGVDVAPPDQVVSDFFDAWDAQDLDTMNALTVKDISGMEWFEGQSGVTLIECDTREYTGQFPAGGSEAYDRAYVKTLFAIAAEQGGSAGIESGQNDWGFWLVREAAGAQWQILDWGH